VLRNSDTHHDALNIAGEAAVAASIKPVPNAASPKRNTGTRPNRSEMEPPGRIVADNASK
jgi:hypothetical protein